MYHWQESQPVRRNGAGRLADQPAREHRLNCAEASFVPTGFLFGGAATLFGALALAALLDRAPAFAGAVGCIGIAGVALTYVAWWVLDNIDPY